MGYRRRGLLGGAGRGGRADGPPAGSIPRPPPCGGIERQHGGRPRSRLAHDSRSDGSRAKRPDGPELIADLGKMTGHVTAALIELDEGRAVAALEDASRQTGEHARGPDLDERPHPIGPQLLDHVDPAHRLRHLANKAVTNVVDRGHRGRRRAAVDAARRGHDRHTIDRLGELRGGSSEKRRVERAGHGQTLRADAPTLEKHLDGINGAGLAANHRLLGRVLGTHPHLPGKRNDRRGDLLATGDHGKHRPLFRTMLLDGASPGLRGPCALGEAPGAGGHQRRKFSEAVAGDDVGAEPHPLENGPGEEVAKIHPPLGVPHRRAHGIVRLPGDPGEGLKARRPGTRVEGLDGLLGCGRLRDEPAEHVGVLRSLPRKEGRYERAPFRQGTPLGGRRRGGDHSRRSAGGPLLRRRRHREPVVHDDVTDQGFVDDGDRSSPIATGIDRRHDHRRRRGHRHARRR